MSYPSYNFTFSSVNNFASFMASARLVMGKRLFKGLRRAPSAVGSYMPEMQEVPAETLQRAKIFIDSRSAALEEAGDLIQPIRAGLFDETHICGELGDVVLGKIPGRQSPEEITYFKSVGNAVQDISVAQAVFQKAEERGEGRIVEV